MRTVSRRGLFVLGGTGAAGAVLGACGAKTSERDDGDDAALLSAALAAETALGAAYAEGNVPVGGRPAGPLEEALTAFGAASKKRAADLTRLLEDVGGQSPEPDSSQGNAIGAQNAAIGAYREAAGPLSTAELRGTAIAFLAAVAAELGAFRGLAGEDPVPRAFLTGGAEEPNLAADATNDDEPATTTTGGGG
jgi:hypothetical protein